MRPSEQNRVEVVTATPFEHTHLYPSIEFFSGVPTRQISKLDLEVSPRLQEHARLRARRSKPRGRSGWAACCAVNVLKPRRDHG